MTSNEQLALIADQIRTMANMGLRFADDVHKTERYEKFLSFSVEIMAILTASNTD